MSGNIEAITYILSKNSNINAQNSNGKTPLHFLLEQNDINAATKLLVIKEFFVQYNLDLQDKNGKTALDYAQEYQPEILADLEQMGVGDNSVANIAHMIDTIVVDDALTQDNSGDVTAILGNIMLVGVDVEV